MLLLRRVLSRRFQFMCQSTQRTQPLEGLQVAHNDIYSPLDRGILTGQFKSFEDLSQKDIRRTLPRFQSKDFEINMKLIKELEKIASKTKRLPSQLALGWPLSLSKQEGMPEIYPIPGSSTAQRVKEDLVQIFLSDEEMKEINKILVSCEVIGDKDYPMGMRLVNG